MINREIILNFATKAHEGQTRKNSGLPYISHCKFVANAASEAVRKITDSACLEDQAFVVGMLHDTLEDCPTIQESDIVEICSESGFQMQHSLDILEYVKLLTRKSKEDNIIEYLNGIRSRFLTKIVKISDLYHNLSDLKPGNLRDKYLLCLDYLYRA